MADLTAYFIAVAILIGLFARMRPGSITNGFVESAKSLLYTALLVGFAQGIQVVRFDGLIMDALINGLVQPRSYLPTLFVPSMMVFVQSITNLLLPSYSILIGSLGLASMPFTKWFRFARPPVSILIGSVLVLSTIGEIIKVGSF